VKNFVKDYFKNTHNISNRKLKTDEKLIILSDLLGGKHFIKITNTTDPDKTPNKHNRKIETEQNKPQTLKTNLTSR